MAKAHVLVLPFPAQGQVTPLMELSHRLVDHGFKVTFIVTEVDQALVVADVNMGWSFEVARKFGIRAVSVWSAAMAALDLNLKIPKLIEDGLIDDKDQS
ncbi:putative glucosyl transferase [Panicum miliaceum]|uniref:Glucosyl transferase n=1 Tax=Panicum miliaceum TaxID=4540 RepID=A0A3L6Q118_PANMI|nr:putative glucosyl transferase [Panicum miliaceum]